MNVDSVPGAGEEVLADDSTICISPRQGRRDARTIVVVRAHGRQAEKLSVGLPDGAMVGQATMRAERMTAVTAQVIGEDGRRGEILALADDHDAEGMADRFWRWLPRRAVLLLVGSVDRDLAMLGPPPNMTLRRAPLRPDPRTFCGEWRSGRILAKGRPGGWNRRLDVMAVGNVHHEGIYADSFSFEDLARWVSAWVELIRENDLGPKIEWTIARQALLSFRRVVHSEIEDAKEAGKPVRTLRWHKDRDLHAFEREVFNAQSPLRINPADGRHKEVYRIDLQAAYLAILAQKELPRRKAAWIPDGCPLRRIDRALEFGLLVLVDATDHDGRRHLLTTVDFAEHRPHLAVVNRAALYSPGRPLAGWAEKMYELRTGCDELVQTSVKALGNSLWGRLAAKNYAADPYEYLGRAPLEPGTSRAVATVRYGRMWETGAVLSRDEDGDYYLNDTDAWRPERFPALAAHVLAHGRRQTEALAGDQRPLYGHTDSVWLASPPTGRSFRPRGLGEPIVRRIYDVEWRNGARYEGGVLKSSPGVARVGSRYYHPYTDIDIPHTAVYEIRR